MFVEKREYYLAPVNVQSAVMSLLMKLTPVRPECSDQTQQV